MKKTYIHPTMEAQSLEVTQIIALSIQEGTAKDQEVLVKSDGWDVWSDDEVVEE